MKTVFEVGDRVRTRDGYEAVVTHIGNSGPCIYWDEPSGSWADNVLPESLTLVSRPVYPKPGEVPATYITAAEVEAVKAFLDGDVSSLGAHSQSVMMKAVQALFDRAREQMR